MKRFAMALALAMTVTSIPVSTKAEVTKDQPVIVVTGQEITGGTYSLESIVNEKSYTMEELSIMAAHNEKNKETYLYSMINKSGTKGISRGKGIRVDQLLLFSGMDGAKYKNAVSVVASDGFKVSYVPSEKRYYFPNVASGKKTGKKAVPEILAWAEGKEEGSTKVPKTVTDLGYLQLMAGQTKVKDVNNSMFNRNVNSLVVGDATEQIVLTIGKEVYTRADLLLMPRATMTHSYTNSASITVTAQVRGVALEDLLKDAKDSAKVTFETADQYAVDASGKTVGELKKAGYILAYEEVKTEGGSFEGIYETAKSDDKICGYLTLFADGEKGAKMITKITVK